MYVIKSFLACTLTATICTDAVFADLFPPEEFHCKQGWSVLVLKMQRQGDGGGPLYYHFQQRRYHLLLVVPAQLALPAERRTIRRKCSL